MQRDDTDLDAIFFGDSGAEVRSEAGPSQMSQPVATCRSDVATSELPANPHGCSLSPEKSQKSQMSQGVPGDTKPARENPRAFNTEAPEQAALLALVEWQDADIERFTARRNRLLRWGWPTADAEALAERLTLRDRSGDTRASCADCRNYGPGRCGNSRRAGLHSPEVGRDLVTMLQHCPGAAP
jgi:hypothetical protein